MTRSLLALVVAAAALGCQSGGEVPIACPGGRPPLGPSTVYLAFDGATLDSVADGLDDAVLEQSGLIGQTTTFSPFFVGDADRADKIDQVVGEVQTVLAPYAVDVTTTRPEGDHMMIVFAGQDGGGGLLGLVRLDCGKGVHNDVAILFAGVSDPARGPFALANEVMFAITRSIGLAKSSELGHPCSCDPSGGCTNDQLCELTADARVAFSTCDNAAVQDEPSAFANVFGCRP